MRIERLFLADFRNYASLDWRPSPGVDVLVGPNGAGKTNLLEAAFLVLSGRSPRARAESEMVREGCTETRVGAEVEVGGRRSTVGVRLSPEAKQVEVDGRPVTRLGELAFRTPVVLFRPEDLLLAQGPASVRRRFLDEVGRAWSRSYDASLEATRKALGQRNALLRRLGAGASTKSAALLLESWDEAFVAAAAGLLRRRLALLAELVPALRRLHAALSGNDALEVRYASSVPELGRRIAAGGAPTAREAPETDELLRQALREALQARLAEELARGFTLVGPHRDDLRLLLAGRDLRSYGSQGQQRTVAVALRMAQFVLLRQRLGESPLLLLDDVFSELDGERRQRLLQLLLPDVEQAWLTVAEERQAGAGGSLLEIAGSERVKWFRVFSGSLSEVPAGDRSPSAR
ncbi:MAG: DNA replication and repair protein RecF [Bacillota bacterium]|nr:DNA replication and repair protein RecF [Bacillota bacterium]